MINTILRIPTILLPSIFLLIGTVGLNASSSGSIDAPSVVSVAGSDLGVVLTQTTQRVQISIRNSSDSSVAIDSVVPSKSSFRARLERPLSIPAHGQIDFLLEVKIGSRVGQFSIGYDLFTPGSKTPISKFVVRGFADWLVDPASMNIGLGAINASIPGETKVVPILRDGASLRMTTVEESSPLLTVRIDPNGRSLKTTIKKSKTWGLFDESVLINTDSKLQPKVSLRVKGDVRGEIVPSTSVVSFGVVREGTMSEQIVRLTDVSRREIRFGSIASSGTSVSAKSEGCVPVEPGCKLLRLAVSDGKAGTVIQGRVEVEFPDYHSRLSLVTSGYIVGKDEVIGSLNQDTNVSVVTPAPISAMLKSATKKPIEMEIPEGTGPLVTWSVSGDDGVYGFEIYRAEVSEGPFVRASRSLIRPMSIDPRAGAVYRWRDQDVMAGNIYWYYVGIIYKDGRRQVLTSPQRVTAK